MKRKYEKPIKNILYAMIAIFVILVLYFALPLLHDSTRDLFPVVALLGLAFLILGIMLTVFAVKSKPDKKLKVFLILAGASAIGPLAGSILHNMFYAFAVLSESIAWLHAVFEFVHAAFFILAMLVCPIVFLVGAVGGIVMLLKKNKKAR